MTGIATLSAALLLLGGAMLTGCAYDPAPARRADASSQRDVPAPGTVVVHMNAAVTSETTVAR